MILVFFPRSGSVSCDSFKPRWGASLVRRYFGILISRLGSLVLLLEVLATVLFLAPISLFNFSPL